MKQTYNTREVPDRVLPGILARAIDKEIFSMSYLQGSNQPRADGDHCLGKPARE
jgi:hypothetical protein